jgi:hypothetical protein
MKVLEASGEHSVCLMRNRLHQTIGSKSQPVAQEARAAIKGRIMYSQKMTADSLH